MMQKILKLSMLNLYMDDRAYRFPITVDPWMLEMPIPTQPKI